MLFLLKKIFPQLFISIILEDKKNIVKASIYRGKLGVGVRGWAGERYS